MEVDDITLNEDEEMDIDTAENENIKETEKDLSFKMDIKIRAKQRRLEEEETNRKADIRKNELKKRFEEEKEIENQRKEKKMMKQRSKNLRKRANKRKKLDNPEVNIENEDIPNIKEVPQAVKHLVKEEDVVYQVPGDGACLLNSAAAFFFHDEVFGPKLRRRINEFFVQHYTKKYKTLSPCSESSPFKIEKANGEQISFTNTEKLFEFLLNPESEYMWSDGIELVLLADMYQVNIKIITMKGIADQNPNVNWVHPDKEMEAFAELKNVEQDDLVLLHEAETHFNLVISRDSDLAKQGCLSYRFNFGSTEKSEYNANYAKTANEDTEHIRDIEKQLREVMENMTKLQKEYNKCEEESKKKTEEVETLKTEIKDLNKIVELKESVVENVEKDDTKIPKVVKNIQNSTAATTDEKEYNCHECCYQGVAESDLKRHIILKHETPINQTATFKCRTCGNAFSHKWELMKHRKSSHRDTVALATFVEQLLIPRIN